MSIKSTGKSPRDDGDAATSDRGQLSGSTSPYGNHPRVPPQEPYTPPARPTPDNSSPAKR